MVFCISLVRYTVLPVHCANGGHSHPAASAIAHVSFTILNMNEAKQLLRGEITLVCLLSGQIIGNALQKHPPLRLRQAKLRLLLQIGGSTGR